MTALHFPVVAWGVRSDQLATDAQALQLPLKNGWFVLAFGKQTVGEFCAVVRLDTLNRKGGGLTTWRRKTVDELELCS